MRTGDAGSDFVEAAEVTKRRSRLDRNPLYADIVIYVILVLLGLITLLPMVNVLAKSLSESGAISANPLMLIPSSFTLDAYQYIFETPVLMRSFGVTVFATVVGTGLNLLLTTTAAYGLSKTSIPGYRLLMWIVILPMLIGAGLIPTYLLLKSLGLINSIWVLVFMGLVSPFNLILMRNFFWSIPNELEESARIDGASDLKILWHVVLPLSKPVIATIGLFYGVGHWNDFFTGLFFINDNSKWPLQVVLRSIIIDQSMLGMGGQGAAPTVDLQRLVVSADNIRAATIIFATIPILLAYPFLQRYFVKGIILGAVKG
ncbi:carbohydrate ABC transporter permease [Tenggerimyces flavus]|uniref:Carbohydrate ABC transporter permease n=1 Tax=Tenggerimyces flavus TaxID=1708749 RepID=A0ABV7YM23_9ACTN|nr:carbohydrate ABC transporter permease [Tenggerimyces flavus]MBM7787365.1 putative aldouronate transport system permease protein [Tenggerimyces flavus]